MMLSQLAKNDDLDGFIAVPDHMDVVIANKSLMLDAGARVFEYMCSQLEHDIRKPDMCEFLLSNACPRLLAWCAGKMPKLWYYRLIKAGNVDNCNWARQHMDANEWNVVTAVSSGPMLYYKANLRGHMPALVMFNTIVRNREVVMSNIYNLTAVSCPDALYTMLAVLDKNELDHQMLLKSAVMSGNLRVVKVVFELTTPSVHNDLVTLAELTSPRIAEYIKGRSLSCVGVGL
jgi:hypothetical protein